MKKILLAAFTYAAGFDAGAQDLAPDQNPNYKVSMQQYQNNLTALQATNNTTIQNTYKAYDFSTAKAERKAERRANRQERRLFNSYNNFNYYDPNAYYRNYNVRPYQYRYYYGWRRW
ncbi:hypothetical protein ACFOWM_06800 [Ferruginibacter yonginensis]|uniref:Uncharacterized protein n=1 Tax=Ferruginibacter yonginensis TaxID=1310416 RepID=A0ABV8QRU4_9BACT